MNNARTLLSFWIAIAGVLAALVFAWQATVASSGATGAGRTFVGWIPRGYAIEAVAISALISIVLAPCSHSPAMEHRRRVDRLRCAHDDRGHERRDSGRHACPRCRARLGRRVVGNSRCRFRCRFRAIAGGIVGAVAPAALMLLVIAMAMMLSPRSS